MKSVTTSSFRKAFEKLPRSIQNQAYDAYARFKLNPWHPGIQFKQVHSSRAIFSARISLDYRAVGMIDDDGIVVWFWVGNHADYEKLLRQL